jgi:hypothetical protein
MTPTDHNNLLKKYHNKFSNELKKILCIKDK